MFQPVEQQNCQKASLHGLSTQETLCNVFLQHIFKLFQNMYYPQTFILNVQTSLQYRNM